MEIMFFTGDKEFADAIPYYFNIYEIKGNVITHTYTMRDKPDELAKKIIQQKPEILVLDDVIYNEYNEFDIIKKLENKRPKKIIVYSTYKNKKDECQKIEIPFCDARKGVFIRGGLLETIKKMIR